MANYTTHSGITFEAPDLLPCPCCGGEVELLFKGNDYTKKRSVTIKCKRCRLQRTDAAIRKSAQWCAEVAIEQWNVREGNPDSQSSANCAIFDVNTRFYLEVCIGNMIVEKRHITGEENRQIELMEFKKTYGKYENNYKVNTYVLNVC